MSKIQKVIDNNYCIGCGACAIKNTEFTTQRDQYGLITAKYNNANNIDPTMDEVCPFATSTNENILAEKYFSKTEAIQHEPKLGYYLSLYAGHTSNQTLREKTTAGGLTTWLLEKLFKEKLIDGVIHVAPKKNSPDLFEYTVSYNIDEIESRTKSRYYHVSFSDVKDFLNSANLSGKYAFVGVPCYIKAMRLLCENDPKLKEHIAFYFGIFCGHMKTSAFGELLSWQQGISPKELKNIDFRVKDYSRPSSQYAIKVSDSKTTHQESNFKLYGTDWGLGLFKPKACDWCDDISAELADVVLGDAWLPQYVKDSSGTNIVIVRNPILQELLINAESNREVSLDILSEKEIIQSQAGNYRHRQEGLSVRLASAEKNGLWVPKKRVKKDDYVISPKRQKLYLVREEIAEKSHIYFLQAKQKNSLIWFLIKMLPLEIKYHYYNGRLIKGTLRSLLNIFKIGKQ